MTKSQRVVGLHSIEESTDPSVTLGGALFSFGLTHRMQRTCRTRIAVLQLPQLRSLNQPFGLWVWKSPIFPKHPTPGLEVGLPVHGL